MVNGIRGSTVCNMPAMGVMEAHLWNHVLDGDYWADWNPDRVRVTLCDSVMAPVVLYKEGEMDMRDLSEWELGGQAIRSPTIDMWTRHVTTGTFLHEVSTGCSPQAMRNMRYRADADKPCPLPVDARPSALHG